MLLITNDAFWDAMPSIDKEIHTTTYMLSYLGSTVKQTTLLSRHRSTVKRTTCYNVQKYRQTNYIAVASQKYRQTNYMLSRPRSAVKLYAVAFQKYRQTNYMMSRPRSTVKLYAVASQKYRHTNYIAVASQKYRETNYMLSRPRSTAKQTTLLTRPTSTDKETTCFTFQKSVIFTYIFGWTRNIFKYCFRSCYLLRHILKSEFYNLPGSTSLALAYSCQDPTNCFIQSVGVFVMYLHKTDHV